MSSYFKLVETVTEPFTNENTDVLSVSSVRSSLQFTEAETVTDSSLNMNNILQKLKVPLSI